MRGRQASRSRRTYVKTCKHIYLHYPERPALLRVGLRRASPGLAPTHAGLARAEVATEAFQLPQQLLPTDNRTLDSDHQAEKSAKHSEVGSGV